MEMKSVALNDLTEIELDWVVARLLKPEWLGNQAEIYVSRCGYSPTTQWNQAGPIIDRERIELGSHGDQWQATMHLESGSIFELGATPLIAAMRCFVASRLDDALSCHVPAGLVRCAPSQYLGVLQRDGEVIFELPFLAKTDTQEALDAGFMAAIAQVGDITYEKIPD